MTVTFHSTLFFLCKINVWYQTNPIPLQHVPFRMCNTRLKHALFFRLSRNARDLLGYLLISTTPSWVDVNVTILVEIRLLPQWRNWEENAKWETPDAYQFRCEFGWKIAVITNPASAVRMWRLDEWNELLCPPPSVRISVTEPQDRLMGTPPLYRGCWRLLVS